MSLNVQLALLTRLRVETRAQHDAIERTVLLMGDELTLELYTRRIRQFYGFYQPVEERLLDGGGPIAPWLAVQGRRKTPLLKADLIALGQPEATQLPVCAKLPSLSSAAECFGCLYVLEGATLGGVIINGYVKQKLGILPGSGADFFYGYGEQTGLMWQQFRAAITAFGVNSDQHDVVVASARATFETLQQWCEKE